MGRREDGIEFSFDEEPVRPRKWRRHGEKGMLRRSDAYGPDYDGER